MKPKSPDLHRWDVAAFVSSGATFSSHCAVASLPRLADGEPQGLAKVSWAVHGESRERPGSAPLMWMRLEAQCGVVRTCQRCLEPVVLSLVVDHRLRFVKGEAAAAQLDAAGDEDVLALEPTIDLLDLLEDELLLALPVIPLHEVCSPPASIPTEAPGVVDASAPNPFAILATLKPSGGKH